MSSVQLCACGERTVDQCPLGLAASPSIAITTLDLTLVMVRPTYTAHVQVSATIIHGPQSAFMDAMARDPLADSVGVMPGIFDVPSREPMYAGAHTAWV